MTFDFDKATAELPILRGFIDFVNKQSSVYMDCLNGFHGNTVRIERQVARITFPVNRKIENGQEVVVWDSMEDPTQPDVIHSSIRKSTVYLADNAEAGFNEQQICWSIIVFMFAYWDEEVRPAIAKVRGVSVDDIKVDALGDLRLIRNSIIHNKGVVSSPDHNRLKLMRHLVQPEQRVVLGHDQMHAIFVFIKQAIGEIVLHYTGGLTGAPKAADIAGIAIQTGGRAP